jgi:hypothetical protein
MMKRIRFSLVKNPYDKVGRKMAADIKDIFKEKILEKFPPCFHLVKLMRIPDGFLKRNWIKNIMLYSPAFLALGGVVFRMSIYTNDMVSDINVIKELSDYEDKFRTPIFSQLTGNRNDSINALKTFAFDKFEKYGLPVVTEPCELLDLIDEVPRATIPFYQFLIQETAQIHWNPNRNLKTINGTNATFQLYDLFELNRKLIDLYNKEISVVYDTYQRAKKTRDISKPSSASSVVKGFISTLETGKAGLGKAGKWPKWLIGDYKIEKMEPLVEGGIRILKKIDTEILNTELVKTILNGLDIVAKKFESSSAETAGTGLLDSLQELNNAIQIHFNANESSYPFQDFDPLKDYFSKDQLECRKFGTKIMNLLKVESLQKTAINFYTTQSESDDASAVDLVSQTITKKLDFLTKGIMQSARIFLILTMVWTVLYGFKNVLMEFITSRHLPLLTNFQSAYEENFSNSIFYKGDGSTSNDYVSKSAKRFDFNIHEATSETLATINVQIAVWVSLSTFIEKFRVYIKATFDVEVDNEMFGLKNEDFFSFTQSAVFPSLLAGIVSVTFAQWKQYMTRHESDASLIGKLVYFLACFFNSLAIIVSQTTFYIIGLPYLTCILLVVMRYVAHFDEYDPLVEPTKEMIVILYFVIVLMPLKFVPLMFDSLVKMFTDRWILHKTYHLNNYNRSGYEISGVIHSMFLPCSVNKFDHVADIETTLNPGFSYFSHDPQSKHLYRLKFEIHVFHKVAVHVLYLVGTFFLINTAHFVFKAGTLEVEPDWLDLLDSHYIKISMIFAACVIPMLLVSFGMLHVYYNHCHPWTSEGISFGFEPKDNGLWKPFSPQGHSKSKFQSCITTYFCFYQSGLSN